MLFMSELQTFFRYSSCIMKTIKSNQYHLIGNLPETDQQLFDDIITHQVVLIVSRVILFR